MSQNETEGRQPRDHHVLGKTYRLLGDNDCCREWISESRSQFTGRACLSAPHECPRPRATHLDGSRRNNPHPRLATLFHARHGQQDVCNVSTILPDVTAPEVTQESLYSRDYSKCGVGHPRPVLMKARNQVATGILPGSVTSSPKGLFQEMLLPVSTSEITPSTVDPNKYIPRRRKSTHIVNQHFTERPYGSDADTAPAVPKSYRYFLTTQGTPLSQRRHLSAPPCALSLRGLEAPHLPAAGWKSLGTQLLPFLKVPKII